MDEVAQPALREGNKCLMIVMERRFLVEVRAIARDTVWVTFPGADYPLEGMGVELEFHDADGFLRYHTRVVIGPRNKGDGVVLQRAEAASYLKHRRCWRVPVSFQVRLEEAGGKAHTVQLIDLSSEGCMVKSPHAIDLDAALEMRFRLPDQPQRRLKARIIHDHFEDGSWRYGLRFTEVPAETKETLTWFLYREIREQFKEELKEMYPRSSRETRKSISPGALI